MTETEIEEFKRFFKEHGVDYTEHDEKRGIKTVGVSSAIFFFKNGIYTGVQSDDTGDFEERDDSTKHRTLILDEAGSITKDSQKVLEQTMKNENEKLLNYLMEKKTIQLSCDDPQMIYALKCFANVNNSDEVWEYDDIEILSGTAGFLLVRDGKPIRRVVTVMS